MTSATISTYYALLDSVLKIRFYDVKG